MKLRTLVLATALSLSSTALWAADTTLTWYGHAAFKITTPNGKTLLIDPWITNPSNPNGKADLDNIKQADLILISHGHFDHVGNSVEIAKKTGAKLVATYDLGSELTTYGGYPPKQAGMDTMGNFGGTLTLLNGEVKVTFVPAVHSSTVMPPEGSADKDIHDGGAPGGFVIQVKNGPTFYHTGDTDVFQDMALIRKFNHIDVMMACIGGHFTMDPKRAALAVDMVKPKEVIPMHYGTFPILDGTPSELRQDMDKLGDKKIPVHAMKVDEVLHF